MKRTLLLAGLMGLWVLFTGMGGRPGVEVPIPEVDFHATIIDDQDIATKCTNISWDGETFFTGMRGKGRVTIPFERVKKVVSVGEGYGGKKDFQIILKDGEMVAVTFDSDARLTGTTTFGTYRIFAKNIKEIIFE